MEVSLVEAHGVPEGCLLSIRAGSTRRQAPLAQQAEQPFKFPHRGDRDTPFKVDILSAVGSSQVMVRSKDIGGRGVDYTVPLTTLDGSLMGVTLHIKEGPMGNLGAPPSGAVVDVEKHTHLADPIFNLGSDNPIGRRHLAARHARAYLEQHNMLNFIQSILQTMIKEQPSDPWDFIAENLASARASGCASKDTRDQGKYVENKEQGKRENLATAPKTTEAVPQQLLKLDKVRLLAKTALSRAAKNGTLGESRQKAARPANQDIGLVAREKASNSLQNGLNDGNLDRALSQNEAKAKVDSRAEVARTEQRKASDALKGGAENGNLRNALREGALADLDKLRKKTANGLRREARKGGLSKCLFDLKPTSLQEKEANEIFVDAVRDRAVGTLVRGAETGDLTRFLNDAPASTRPEVDLEQLRHKTSQLLQQGLDDEKLPGLLASIDDEGNRSGVSTDQWSLFANRIQDPERMIQAREKIADQKSMDQVREKASKALQKGFDGDEIVKMLAEWENEDFALAAREKARNSLKNGLNDGNLDGALSQNESKTKVDSRAEVARTAQRKASDALKGGIENGNLHKALREGDQYEKLKFRVAHGLTKATINGNLPFILDHTRTTAKTTSWRDFQHTDPTDLKLKAQKTLLEGVDEGMLIALLSDDADGDAQPQQKSTTSSHGAKPDLAAKAARKARNSLDRGLKEGSLDSALDGPYGPLDRLRERTASGLRNRVAEGRLVGALKAAGEGAKEETKKAAAAAAIKAIRYKARNDFENGMKEGRMEAAMKPTPDINAVREMTRDILETGVQSGSLGSIISDRYNDAAEASPAEQEAAALKIQSIQRGKQSRRDVEAKKEEKNQEKKAEAEASAKAKADAEAAAAAERKKKEAMVKKQAEEEAIAKKKEAEAKKKQEAKRKRDEEKRAVAAEEAKKQEESGRPLPEDAWGAVADIQPEVLKYALETQQPATTLEKKVPTPERKGSITSKQGSRGSSRGKVSKKAQFEGTCGPDDRTTFWGNPEPPPAKPGGSQEGWRRSPNASKRVSPSTSQTGWRPPAPPQSQWQQPVPQPNRALGFSQSHVDLVNEVQAVRSIVGNHGQGVPPSTRSEELAKEVADLKAVNARMRERNDALKKDNWRIKENLAADSFGNENLRLKRELDKLAGISNRRNTKPLPGLGQSQSTPGLHSGESGMLPRIDPPQSSNPTLSKHQSKDKGSSSCTNLPPIHH